MNLFSKYVLTSIAILGASLSMSSCAPTWTPATTFLERAVVLIYPSGPGGMGYKVKHLADICARGNGAVDWEQSDSDAILICDRIDPASKARFVSRWLLRPGELDNPDGSKVATAAILGLAINGQSIDRSALEVIASGL